MTDTPERVLLCFGDSNTHGSMAMTDLGVKSRFPRGQRWTGVMADALGPSWHVIEEGQSGRTTCHNDPIEGDHKNGLTMLPALLESHRPLDLVLIMLGTNDLKSRFSVSAFEIARSVERLGQLVLGSDAGRGGAAPSLLLVAPAPITETGWLGKIFAGGAQKSEELGAELALAADRLGAGYFDAANVAKTDPRDGIHLSAEAQQALGKALAETVQSTIIR